MRTFQGISFYIFKDRIFEKIREEIKNEGKDKLLGMDETEYEKYLVSEYELFPLEIVEGSEEVLPPRVVEDSYYDSRWREHMKRKLYHIKVRYQFTGSPILFGISPSTKTLSSEEVSIDDRNNFISFEVTLLKQDVEAFNRGKNTLYNAAFGNIVNVNNDLRGYVSELSGFVKNAIKQEKDKYNKENDFFKAINVKINEDTKPVFTAPTIRKKIIPKPNPKSKKEQQYSSEPMMSTEMYDDVVKTIYETGKNMEKKPSLYLGKDEEQLREQFVLFLETRYEGTTATGETFNKKGKTDLLLKYEDGTNLFVAECKIWNGVSEYLKGISQLFDRYLTWRDSKAAVIIFVKEKGFTKILEKIKAETMAHECAVKFIGKRGESSFSYQFCLPKDKDKVVHLEVIIFHFED